MILIRLIYVARDGEHGYSKTRLALEDSRPVALESNGSPKNHWKEDQEDKDCPQQFGNYNAAYCGEQ